ncbi:MAG: hypothetical protein FWH21_09700 [Kiritimatiellaeota bacterium]|nr:hypothetical protein [Kiritimatiellota bacterium]
MAMIGICVWSLYDGMKGWPQANAVMDDARPLLLAVNLTASAWLDSDDGDANALDRLFTEVGHKTPSKLIRKISETQLPKEKANDTKSLEQHAQHLKAIFEAPIYSEGDLQTQWWQAGVAALLGVLAWITVARKIPKRFVADDNGMSGTGFGAQVLAYEDISEINWAKWDEKGIIVLTFKSGKTVRLDGWHFSGMTGIADEITKHRPDLAPKTSSLQ